MSKNESVLFSAILQPQWQTNASGSFTEDYTHPS